MSIMEIDPRVGARVKKKHSFGRSLGQVSLDSKSKFKNSKKQNFDLRFQFNRPNPYQEACLDMSIVRAAIQLALTTRLV
jgi:hypothetical protein